MISVSNLNKYFDNVWALANVSFEVEKNEIVGLLGNNGAGKTTLMRILTTYLPASSGIARVAGHDVMTESMEVRKNIGYLPESIPLYPEMRVNEYLEFRAKLKGVDRRQRKARVDHVMATCRLQGVERRLMGKLSKGFRQRVGLADALVADPKILILDEPTDGLDPKQKQEALALLRELGKDHTIMLSSHLLAEVESIVDRVLILRRGQLALARRLVELEADPVIVIEVRGPQDRVRNVLETADGVESAVVTPSGDLCQCEVRTRGHKDLREALASRLIQNGFSVRRLDLKRRKLVDRWNEINSADVVPAAPAPQTAAVTPAAK